MSSNALRRGAPVMAGVSLALLSSCAPALPAMPQTAEPPSRPATAEPAARATGEATKERPTIAERAARADAMLAQAGPSRSSTTPASRDYPRLMPAPRPRADGTLQSFAAVDTGPYLADNNVHTLTWTNDSGRQLAVYKVYLWTGVDKGGVGDVHIDARRTSDNSYIGILQWDHYADPTSPQHGQQFDYPSPMMLDPGETIVVTHSAKGFAPGFRAHHVLVLWVK